MEKPDHSEERAYLFKLYSLLDVIAKKWSLLIIAILGNEGEKGFNELKNELEGISPKTLSETLKKLEAPNLIAKRVLPTSPPGVKYSLTQDGWKLREYLIPILTWESEKGAKRAREAQGVTHAADKVQLHPSKALTLEEIVERLRENPRFNEVSGILTFTGVVKGVSRDGKELSEVAVEPTESTLRNLQALVEEYEKKPGVLEVRIHRNIGRLETSDPISHVLLATTADEKDIKATFRLLYEILEKGKRVSGMRLKERNEEGWYYTKPRDRTKSYD